MRSISASPEIRIMSWSAPPVPALGQRVSRLHRCIELRRVAPLLARAQARGFAPAKGGVVIDARRRQVDHDHAGFGVALEMRRALEASRADAGAEAELGVVGDRERVVVIA